MLYFHHPFQTDWHSKCMQGGGMIPFLSIIYRYHNSTFSQHNVIACIGTCPHHFIHSTNFTIGTIENKKTTKVFKSTLTTNFGIEEKKNYINDLFNDNYLKDNQKEIDSELNSLNARNLYNYLNKT